MLLFGCWLSHALTLANWEEGVTTGRKNFNVIEIFSSWLLKCSAFTLHLGGHSWHLTFSNRSPDSFLWKVSERKIYQMQAWQSTFYVELGHHFPLLIDHCDQFALPCNQLRCNQLRCNQLICNLLKRTSSDESSKGEVSWDGVIWELASCDVTSHKGYPEPVEM